MVAADGLFLCGRGVTMNTVVEEFVKFTFYRFMGVWARTCG